MATPTPQISVVIPCLNEEEAVGRVVEQALDGIRRSGRPGEVIVVDNASTDRSAEVASAHGARVVSEPRRGYGSAYLAGLAEARGESQRGAKHPAVHAHVLAQHDDALIARHLVLEREVDCFDESDLCHRRSVMTDD